MINWETKVSFLPLLEKKLYEELGVSEEVLTYTETLMNGISTLISEYNPNSGITQQNASATLQLNDMFVVLAEVEINYFKAISQLRDACEKRREGSVWYEPWANTLHIIVDVCNGVYGKNSTKGLIQHELTHAYRDLLCKDKGFEKNAPESYSIATKLAYSNDENLSAASWAVYFTKCDEISANANELYPWFLECVSDGTLDYTQILNDSIIYQAVIKVRKLNDRIQKEGRGILSNASKHLGIPIGNLVNICTEFPKRAMANISKVYAKAKKDYDDKMTRSALDYGVSKHRRYVENTVRYYKYLLEENHETT